MVDRIHLALDGELPIDGLTPAERGELQRRRAMVGIALEPIRRLPAIDVSGAVMARVAPRRVSVQGAIAATARWFWSPRPLTLRPVYAMAVALTMVTLFFASLTRPTRSGRSIATAAASATAAPGRVMVQFRLGGVEAHDVALIGDFNGWHPDHRLQQLEPGVWSVEVALEPGVYHYVFVVDGKAWRLDPLAPRVTDGFGGASSRISVLAPEARS